MTKVVSAVPMTDQQGQHKSFTGQNGTIWSFWYTLDNGMQGEVTHKTQQARFPAGSEVEASDNTNPQYPQYKKLKLDKPGGQQGGGKSWSPEREARIQAQGLVQAAIAAGATTSEAIDASVKMGLDAVNRWTKAILGTQQPAQAPQQPPAQPQAPYQHPYQQPPQNPNPPAYHPQGAPGAPQVHQGHPQQPIGYDPNAGVPF